MYTIKIQAQWFFSTYFYFLIENLNLAIGFRIDNIWIDNCILEAYVRLTTQLFLL